MMRVQGNCENGNITVTTGGLLSSNVFQGSYPSCTVTVNVTGGGIATIFSDNIGTPLANPFTAAANGHWFFYTANGHVDVQISGGGLPAPLTFGDIIANDPSIQSGSFTGTFFASASIPVATSGVFRLASADIGPTWRNNANSGDLGFSKNASDVLNWPAAMTITGSLGLGANAITAGGFISGNASPALSGTNRYASSDTFKIRNNANNADLNLLSKNVSDVVAIGDTAGVSVSGPFTTTGSFSAVNGTFSGTLTAGGLFTASADAVFAGPNPYFDVRAFGAKCDDNGTGNGTDDTTAIQNAIAAAVAVGGTVNIPEGKFCRFTTTLNLDTAIHVAVITGAGTGRARIGPLASKDAGLVYTGTTSPVISARSSAGIAWKTAVYLTNAAFAGMVFDTSHVNASDTQAFLLEDMVINDVSTSCAVGINWDKTINSMMRNSSIFGCVKQIRGAAGAGSYSVNNRVERMSFQPTANTTSFIANPGTDWLILNNDFEVGSATVNTLNITDGFAGTIAGIIFAGNFVGDASGNPGRTIINLPGVSIQGFVAEGNTFGGYGNADNVVNFGAGSNFVIHGNNISGTFGTFLTCGALCTGQVGPQNYSNATITTFRSCVPQNGYVWDNAGIGTIYTQQFNIVDGTGSKLSGGSGINTFIGLTAGTLFSGDTWQVAGTGGAQTTGPITTPEVAAPGGVASKTVIYDDSTSHRLTMKNNNGTATAVTGFSDHTLTLKKGSGGGNYTSASTTYVVVDATNLCLTVTIPTGFKLEVRAQGSVGTSTAIVAASVAITDNAACSTANAGLLHETAVDAGAIGATAGFALGTIITGDGAAHNVALQFKTANASDSALMLNSSATLTPTMTFTMIPSN
jgi:hypothetical protein